MRYALVALQWFYFGLCCYLYPRLPERFPTHFGVGGKPDDWSQKSLLNWFALYLVGLALTVLLYYTGRFATNHPQLWNVPEKARFLALSPEARAPVTRIMQDFMTSAAIGVTLLFMAVQLTMYETAIGRTNTLPWYFAVALAGTLMSTTLGAVWISIRIKREILRASAG